MMQAFMDDVDLFENTTLIWLSTALVLGSWACVLVPDVGMPLSVTAYLAGCVFSTALNPQSEKHHRPMPRNIVVFTSLLVFAALLISVSSDTTRVVQAASLVLSYIQLMLVLSWSLFYSNLDPHRRSKRRLAKHLNLFELSPWPLYAGAVVCFVVDAFYASTWQASAGLFLAAYSYVRAASCKPDDPLLIFVWGASGVLAGLVLCATNAATNPMALAASALLFALLFVTLHNAGKLKGG